MDRPESHKNLKFRDYLAVRHALKVMNQNPEGTSVEFILEKFYEEFPEYQTWEREE